jgi:4-amino-4-deoxy-L-arabinose transferase-like glycosyltransferase
VALTLICQRIFQPKLAFWLGLAIALYIPLAIWCVMVMRETLIAFLVAITTYCLVRALQEPGPRWYWITGLSFVLTFFCQPTFFSFPLWMGLAVWIGARNFRKAVLSLVPLLVCTIVAISLWTVRNWLLTSRFIPLTGDHIGCYFYLGVMNVNQTETGALTRAQIRYLGVAEDDPYNTYHGLVDHYVRGSLETRLRDGPELLSRALRLIRYQPTKYFGFTLKRFHRLWLKDLWAERTEESYINLRPLDQFRTKHTIGRRLIVGLIYAFGYSSLLGIVLFWRQTLGLLVPILSLLSFHVWMNAETRYALAVHPYILIYCMITVFYLYQRLAGKEAGKDIFNPFPR